MSDKIEWCKEHDEVTTKCAPCFRTQVTSLTRRLVASELLGKEKDEALRKLNDCTCRLAVGTGMGRMPKHHAEGCARLIVKDALKSSPAKNSLATALLEEHEAGEKFYRLLNKGSFFDARMWEAGELWVTKSSRVRALLRESRGRNSR